MKHAIFTLVLLSVSAFSFAQGYAERHQQNCDGVEGSCRVVYSPQKINRVGYCSGIIYDKYTCVVNYDADDSGSAMLNLECGTAYTTVLSEDFAVQSLQYKVATIQRNYGRQSVIEDLNTYVVLANQSIDMFITDGPRGVQGSVKLNLESGSIDFTNVRCE